MNASAAATCFGSSWVARRTRMLVSTARMAPLHVSPNAFLQLGQGAPPRRLLEQGAVQVRGRVSAGPPDDDRRALLVPLQDGPGPHPQLPPDFGGDGDLPLCGELRMGQCHEPTVPR